MTRDRDLVDIMGGGSAPTRGRAPHRFVDDDDNVVKSDLHDLDLALHYDTGKAILVSETGDESKAVWLPKAQIEILKTGKTVTGTSKSGASKTWPLVTVTCPQWLAHDKGLI